MALAGWLGSVSANTWHEFPAAMPPDFRATKPNTLHDTRSCLFRNTHTHTHTHPFNGPLSRYQKGKTNQDFTEATDSGSGSLSAGQHASLHLAPDR